MQQVNQVYAAKSPRGNNIATFNNRASAIAFVRDRRSIGIAARLVVITTVVEELDV